jgi:hypothetical protein
MKERHSKSSSGLLLPGTSLPSSPPPGSDSPTILGPDGVSPMRSSLTPEPEPESSLRSNTSTVPTLGSSFGAYTLQSWSVYFQESVSAVWRLFAGLTPILYFRNLWILLRARWLSRGVIVRQYGSGIPLEIEVGHAELDIATAIVFLKRRAKHFGRDAVPLQVLLSPLSPNDGWRRAAIEFLDEQAKRRQQQRQNTLHESGVRSSAGMLSDVQQAQNIYGG